MIIPQVSMRGGGFDDDISFKKVSEINLFYWT